MYLFNNFEIETANYRNPVYLANTHFYAELFPYDDGII